MGDNTTSRRDAWPLALALALTLAYSSLADGGFSSGSQSLTVALAGVLVLIGLFGPRPPSGAWIARVLRSPFVVCLLMLATLSALSAIWTIGSTSGAIRHGALIVAYAAIAFGSACLAMRLGPWPLALGIAVLAIVESAIGLEAMLTHTLPDAEAIYHHWRPGGTYQYPPALAVLQISALPILVILAGHAKARRTAVVLTALAAILLGLVIGASGTRLEPLLGLLAMIGACVLAPPGAQRRAGLVIVILAVLAAAFSFWVWQPGAISTHHRRAHVTTSARIAHPARTTHTDLLHGRQHGWRAAIDTWQARPILGFGAGTYFEASRARQGSVASLYPHNLALEQAAELGTIGFLLVLGLYFAGAQVLWRARTQPLALALIGPTVVIFLVSNLLDWTWHLAGLTAIWAAATGALVAIASTESAESADWTSRRWASPSGGRPTATD